MEMLKAIRANDARKVQKKLQKGFDVNKQISETNNNKKQVFTIPICLAAARGHREIVELLLSYGANLNACNYDWSTPLHMATYHGFLEIIRLLLQRNVNMNNTDQQGNTVLHLAVLKNNFEAAVLFLEDDVDIEVRNNTGETAIEIARAMSYDHLVTIIADKKKMTNEQAANEDERRVQAKQLITEITQKERLQRQLQEIEISELTSSLKEKEEKEIVASNELQHLNEEANMITSQITHLEARLREVNQARISKERAKNNLSEEIEELQKRKSLHFEGAAARRSHSLKETMGDGRRRNESSEYECPICFEMPFPPRKVYQCGNGHVYCSDCKAKPGMGVCPQCRVPLDPNSPIRNIVYEDMLARKQERRSTAT